MNEFDASITNLEYMHVLDEDGGVSYGCDQEWYGSVWQRMAGCGPTVATNILFYMSRAHGLPLPVEASDKAGCIRLMEQVWRHVTPGYMGMHMPELLERGLLAFAREHGMALGSRLMEVPKKATARPTLSEVTSFIREALSADNPVAFLNLCNGDIAELDEWHWVTLVALKAGPGDEALATIYDGSKSFDMDIGLWLATTKRGGGFVYFYRH